MLDSRDDHGLLPGVTRARLEIDAARSGEAMRSAAERLVGALASTRRSAARRRSGSPVVQVLGLDREPSYVERRAAHAASHLRPHLAEAAGMGAQAARFFAIRLPAVLHHPTDRTVRTSLAEDAAATPDVRVAWDVELPERLRALAEPVFAGRRKVTPELATAIRVGAALLSVDLHDLAPEDSLRYSRLAAGVTLLERRANGEEPADETIVLTVDRRTG